MKQLFYFVGAILTLLIIATFIFTRLLGGEDELRPEDVYFNPDAVIEREPHSAVVNDVPVIFVTTPRGEVEIFDVRTDPNFVDRGTGHYHMQANPNTSTNGFSIMYSEMDDSFAVSLEVVPFSVTRQRASEYLRDLLRVTESELCSLNTFVGIPYNVDNDLAGPNYGFSFCANKIELP